MSLITHAFEWAIGETLTLNLLFSVLSAWASMYFVKCYIPIFITRGLYGGDQCKLNEVKVAEPLGVVAAAVYLLTIFAFIPFPFYQWVNEISNDTLSTSYNLANLRLLSLLAGLITICTGILLGFADDVLDLRWRYKLLFPTLSSLPLLMVYYISDNKTAMLLPNFLHDLVGSTYLNLGALFYIYMVMLVIFCTNAINIIAGINGIEVGQSLVIAASVALFNLIQIFRLDQSAIWYHCLSFCILGPFIGTSFGLFVWNRYPAKAFVGDTYCYWAGITLAVVGITGHFSKTLLLFLLPQIFNFVYSCPQLFHFVPCPRHRLPRLNKKTGKLEMSLAEYEPEKIGRLGHLFVQILRTLRLLHYREFEKEGKKWIEVNNMTIINLMLKTFGTVYEYELTRNLLCLQALCSMLAFFCRFVLSGFIYDTVR